MVSDSIDNSIAELKLLTENFENYNYLDIIFHQIAMLNLKKGELLDDDKIKSQGFLKPENVKSIWALHKSGEYDYTSRIWSILMFQSWLESNL